MKLKKLTAFFAAAALTVSTAVTSFAADTLEISKDGTKVSVDKVSSERGATNTVVDLTMSWEVGKIIFDFVVTDSEIDDTSADAWNQDSVEIRVDSTKVIRVAGATGTISDEGIKDQYDIDWNLTDGGYKVKITYKNSAIKEGYNFTFAPQVNCATAGKRECTLNLEEAQENAYQNDALRTPAVLVGGGEAAESPAEESEEESTTEEETVAEEEEEASPEAEEAAVVAIPVVNGAAVLFEGSASCGNWGQAVKVPTLNGGGNLDPAILTPGCTVEITYSGVTPEVVLQSWSGGTAWAKVAPAEDNGSVAIFTYDDMIASYGSDLSLLDQFNVGDTGGDITVTKVVLKASAGAEAAAVQETAVQSIVAATGDTTAAAATTKGSADTGIEGAAVVLALAVIGTGAVIVSKKRK